MAEAVGLAASIAGLVQLTGSVFKLVTKFCKEAKDAPSKAQELATQARELAGILENLRLLASSLETRDPNCSLKTQYLDACQQTLDDIHGKLNKAQDDFESGKSAKRFSRRLKWPLSLSDTKDLVADLANHRANLHLALSADSMDALLDSLTKQDDIHNMIERKISFDTRVQLNKRRKEVIDFFLRINPQDYLDVSRELRHEATGSWLTSDDSTFSQWRGGANSKLWLSGIAGSGKTVLCGLVIETVLKESDESTAVCYAFCDYKNPDSCLPENIIAALAVQLGLQGGDAFDILEEYFDILHPEDKLPMQPRIEDLLDLVKCLADVYDKVFVVVDGLDECGSHVSRMTQSLKSLADRSEAISAAFFSRKDDDIREKLEGQFEHMEVSAHTKDLEVYTLAEVSKRKVLKNIERTNPALFKDILHTLVQGAQGMFRWVACQIDHISDQPNNNARRKALRELPPTLSETYDRVLQKIFQCPVETQICIQRALHWIALGHPKIKISALCEAVSIRDDMDDIDEDGIIEPETISRRCGCLLRKSLGGKYLEFAHFTVLEYLEKSPVGEFRYSEQNAYRSFAGLATRFLLFPCFDRVPTLSQRVEDAYRKERNRKHPFYKVAVKVPLDFRRNLRPYPARSIILEEEPIFSSLKQLFDAEKNGHFRAWIHTAFYDDNEIDVIHQFSASPMHVATFLISPKLCNLLFTKGADVNGVFKGYTPLCHAVFEIGFLTQNQDKGSDPLWADRETQVLSILLDNGADTSFKADGKSCLAHAFERLRGPSLIPFIRPSTVVPEDAIAAFSDREWNDPLDAQLLQSILELSTSDDAPLQWKPMASPALVHSHRRSLAFPNLAVTLMSNKYSDADYPKALEVAIRAGLTEELSKLIADPRFRGVAAGRRPTAFNLLSVAAESTLTCSGQMAEMLLEFGLDPHILDSTNHNCLHVSCQYGNKDVARVLLARGVDPACRDDKGQTPWHVAASNGHSDIIKLLFRDDKRALQNLATLDLDGRTPLCVALKHCHVETSLSLLEICPSEPLYFQSSRPPLHDAAMIGSQHLFSAMLAKGVVDTETTESNSSPMHYLSASCTAEFAHYLETMYDPLGVDATHATPFEQFFERWLLHNGEAEAGNTIPLNSDLLQLLLPDNLVFIKDGRDMHAWEIICAIIGRGDLCCFASISSDSDESDDGHPCDYYLSRDIRTILEHRVLSSYENTSKSAGIVPLIKAFNRREQKHFCDSSVATLISEVMAASTIEISLSEVDENQQLLNKAISLNAPVLVCRLIDSGADVHRQVSEEMGNEAPRSPFERACSEADMETFNAILTAVSRSDLNELGPTRQSPLELVVKGTSSDKISMVRALCRKGANPRLSISTSSLAVYAAQKRDWSMVRCLSDFGDDISAKDECGWGLAHHAVSHGNLNMLKWVLESAPESSQWHTPCPLTWSSRKNAVWQRTLEDTDMSLLHMASDKSSILTYLLEQRIFVDVNTTTQHGRTPLHYAGFSGSMTCCQILLNSGADLTVRDKNGKLPIEHAFDSGYTDVVSVLLEAGSPLPHGQPHGVGDIAWKPSSDKGLELARREYLEKAILDGNLEQCKVAISHGCSIDQPLPSCGRCTPLFVAVGSRQEDIINWLLEQGASTLDVDCDHNLYENIVVYAASVLNASSCMTRVLSAAFHHQTIWYTTLTNSIYLAVKRGKTEMMESILEHFKQNTGHYHNAWKFRLHDLLQVDPSQGLKSAILDQQACLENAHGETPLHCAARSGRLEAVRILIQYGAKVDSKDGDQRTPLILAAQQNHLPVVKDLLTHGASVESRDSRDQTAMSYAVWKGNLDMVKFLDLASPFSLQYMSVRGSNLLAIDVPGQSQVEIFKYLISKGVELHHHDRNGYSMLTIALRQKYLRDCLVQSRLEIPSSMNKPRTSLNPLAPTGHKSRPNTIKRLYLSLPHILAKALVDQEDIVWGSPLCARASRDDTEEAKMLLALGASIEKDGSSFGTPVMCAIACGKLEMVKLLVREGAKLEYTDEEGNYRSGLLASLPHPIVTQWLLVGRYQDQQKLTNGSTNEEASSRPWSGKRGIKVSLLRWELRRWGESTLDFCIRLVRIKNGIIGKRVGGELL